MSTTARETLQALADSSAHLQSAERDAKAQPEPTPASPAPSTNESKPELTGDEKACWAHVFLGALQHPIGSVCETEVQRAERIADKALEVLRRRGMVDSAYSVIYERITIPYDT